MQPEETLEAAVEEYLERLHIGDALDIDDFARNHPSCENDLKEILPVMVSVERFGDRRTNESEDSMPVPDLDGCGYRLLSKIGAGGMGVVYEALQIDLNRHVAVKILRPSLCADADVRELFRRESRILAMFKHQGIVRVIGTGECAGLLFYTMELVEGRRLDGLTIKSEEDRVLDWGIEAADALACAHSHGIVHADVKPSNLLLDAAGHVRLTDFGLACFSHRVPVRQEELNGTRRYMAPERLEGRISFSGDQYSLGATLVELLGDRPFDRRRGGESLACGRQLKAVLRKALENDPDKRYPSMQALVEDLRRIRRHEPVVAASIPFGVRLGLFCRRHPIYAASAAFIVLLSVSVGIGLVRTKNALGIARDNARTANAAVAQVFDTVSRMPPSAENVGLLTTLVPHYEKIVVDPAIPPTELEDALEKLTQTALCTGKFKLALTTVDRLIKCRKTARRLRYKAVALMHDGDQAGAERICRELVAEYSAGSVAERIEAIWGAQHLPPNDLACAGIPALLGSVLTEEPQNDRARYLCAMWLLEDPTRHVPIADIPDNPLEILDDLSDRCPENVTYLMAYIEAMTNAIAEKPADEWIDFCDSAEAKSNLLVGRFQNSPHAVITAIKFHRTLARAFRDIGAWPGGRFELDGIRSVIMLLFNQPGFPESEKEFLIEDQLDLLERMSMRQPSLMRPRRMRMGLERKIDLYNGPRKKEFSERLEKLK